MTIKGANVLITALRDKMETAQYMQCSDKRKLDDLKPIFLDGTATEKDRETAQMLEEQMHERRFKIETLQDAIDTIENLEVSITL